MPRGGKREGAGRPPGNPDEVYRRVSITLTPRVLLAIDNFAAKNKYTRSTAVERLVLEGLRNL
jgi:metal-responsive CopG/Arc/MetJ family transcriptional regulator